MSRERITITVPNVGTSWVEASIDKKPSRYTIKRARCIPEGTALSVALRVCEDSGDSLRYRVLEYNDTLEYIDSEESVYFHSNKLSTKQNNTGTTYVQVKCDTAGNTVTVLLDIEVG